MITRVSNLLHSLFGYLLTGIWYGSSGQKLTLHADLGRAIRQQTSVLYWQQSKYSYSCGKEKLGGWGEGGNFINGWNDTFISWERSGSVVECLTRNQRAASSSLTGITALWSLSKTHLS